MSCCGVSSAFCCIKHQRDGGDSIFMSSLLPLKGSNSTEEELGLTDVSKGKLKERVETILLLDKILGKKKDCGALRFPWSQNNRNIWLPLVKKLLSIEAVVTLHRYLPLSWVIIVIIMFSIGDMKVEYKMAQHDNVIDMQLILFSASRRENTITKTEF